MKKLIISILMICTPLIMRGQYTVGGDNADFPTLADAFFYFNSAGGDFGDVVLQLIDNSVETTTATIYQSGYDGFTTYNSITIVPVLAGLTISGDVNGPLIDINGAANVVINGSVNGAANLVISNTSTLTFASTIRFTESASYCTVKYCYIKGSGLSNGVIFFSNASSSAGNNNILIDNNFITGNTSGKPVNAIFSSGTVDNENKNNIISNNKFFDHFNPAYNSFGINISANNSLWTITGNSFYQQSVFSPVSSSSYMAIYVNNSGNGYNITGNYIGGQASSSSGSAWTKTGEYNNPFTGILLSAGTGNTSTLSGNFIRNLSWSNSSSATWTALEIGGGDANVTSNEIGSSSGNGSITFTAGANGGIFYGINITGSGNVTCQNNIIGSILAGNNVSTGATHIHCINKAPVPGTTLILNNILGSNSTPNSINASSPSSSGNQLVSGIFNNGTGNITISGNAVANITNGTTRTSNVGTGRIIGILSSNGSISITGNTVYNLTIANNNTGNVATPSVCGISSSGSTPKSANSNIIYGLSNTYSGFQGHVVGMYISGSGSVSITKNFITGLSVSASSSAANITGIRTGYGNISLINNIISLGGDTRTTVAGIHETVGSGNSCLMYFNTVSVKGTLASGSVNKSYCLYSNAAADTRDYRNNIFYNERSTPGGASLHYGAYFISGGSITCNFNDYYVSGSGSVPGYYGGDKTGIPIVPGNDLNSYIVNPSFITPGGAAATDYRITSNITGESGTGVTTDFGDFVRTTPTAGAWEMMQNKWKGTVSTSYNVPGNWSNNSVPPENSDLEFDAAAVNDCYLDANHIVKNVINGTSRKLAANGHKLTITGALTLSGGAQIDANAPASSLSFAGTTAQAINAADYTSGSVNDLIADNAAGITINSDFSINGNLTINMARSLVVNVPNILIVNGTITNNAGASGLVLRSSSNGSDARLINNTDLVSATVELFLSGGAGLYGPRFHYITPPVQTMSINNTSVSACAASLGLTSFSGDLLLFDESKATTSKNAGWQYFDGYSGTTGFNNINSTRGYNMRLPVSGKLTFTGQLNAIQHTYILSYTGSIGYPGWNLIGNPYPCNYDLTGISAFTAADNVDNTAYFNYEGGYGTWNFSLNSGTLNGAASTVFSPIVAPMQGVYVHVNGPAIIDLPVSGKTANSSQPLRAKSGNTDYIPEKIADLKKIKLSLNYNNVVDETLICLLEGATEGFDSNYDAYRMPDEIAPRDWTGKLLNPSIATGAGPLKFAINSLPLPDPSITTIIPISLNIREAGSYTITVPEFENLEGTEVVLKHGGVETKLSKGATYKFTSLPGSYDNLAIIIGSISTQAEEKSAENNSFKTWWRNDQLYILAPDELYSSDARLQIYDMQGKPVIDKNIVLTPGGIINVPVALRGGIYLAHITADLKPFVNKFVVLQ